MAERPLIGLSPNQVSTNGMLGDLAFQDSDSAYIETIRGKVSLDKLDKSIEDTAVDVFVYDTRKDSDGGAWRKRTTHTSWYNETLGTATRGSRREFPAVAVIVADNSSYHIKIYDGDDPDMPLWMEFQDVSSASGLIPSASAKPESIAAFNGVIVFGNVAGGVNSGQAGVLKLSFIEDAAYRYMQSGSSNYSGKWIGGGLANRNTSTPTTGSWDNSLGYIVDNDVNDVTMTVLPNAPIDSATGLPIPTIAVATDEGVSIIKDDGTVVDMVSTATNNDVLGVKFIGDNKLLIRCQNSSTYANIHQASVHEIPSADESASFYSSLGSHIVRYTGADVASGLSITPASYTSSDVDIDHMEHLKTATTNNLAFGFNDRLTLVKETNTIDTVEDNASVAFATTSYNTGWMHGDIKGAFLSDTDTTNVTGTELVTNGTFDSDTSNWTAFNGASLSVSSNELLISYTSTNSAGAYQDITVESGKIYVWTYNARSSNSSQIIKPTLTSTDGTTIFDTGTTSITNGTLQTNDGVTIEVRSSSNHNTNQVYSTTFKVTKNGSVRVRLLANYTANAYFDNVSVRIAELDRSVNNNGLQVFGTITKSAVATGADLVAYSGFSASNYLFQPYNSDLQYGSGDFYVMAWAKLPPVSSSFDVIFDRASSSSTGRIFLYAETSNSLARILIHNGTSQFYADGPSMDDNVWHQLVGVRRGDILSLYFDGEHKSSVACSGSINDTTAFTHIGLQQDGATGDFGGSIALIRTGGSAPSPEQIKKIYEDEKVLFQENAACTLYGSSDAVTALAYDDLTNLLYAGTSSGRSDFQGLRRINNTTTAVTTAMSASNGLVAEQ